MGRWPAAIPAGVQQATGTQRRSARLRTSGRAAERTPVLARLFLRKMGLGLRAVLDGPGPVLRHQWASAGFAPGEQTRGAALLGRLQRRSIQGGKSCQRDLCLGFCRLWADQLSKGEFQGFTYLISQETSKKRENKRHRDKRNQSFWLAPAPLASDFVKWLKVLAYLGSYISHKAECISFMSHFWIHSHAQWVLLSASGGNGAKAELARMP